MIKWLGFIGLISSSVFLVVALTSLARAENGPNKENQESTQTLLRYTCRHTALHPEVPLFRSAEEVRKLIEEHRRQKEELHEKDRTCFGYHDKSFEDLGQLVAADSLKDVCSPRVTELIRAFHKKYIHFYLPEMTREELKAQKVEFKGGSPIPYAFKDFFILFAKQVGATCKRHMMSELSRRVRDINEVVEKEDFAVVRQLNSKKGPLGAILPRRFKELNILASLPSQKGANADDGSKLYLQVDHIDDQLMRIKTACERRLMPVYMELFAPVVKLENLGYIQRTGMTEAKLECDNNERITNWFGIIQACESLRDVEVLYDPTTAPATTGPSAKANLSKARISKMLSQAEASQLRERAGQAGAAVKPAYYPERLDFPHKRASYPPSMMVTDRKSADHELDYFRETMARLIHQRMAKAAVRREQVKANVKNFLNKHKNRFLHPDDSSLLGRLTLFMDRHPTLVHSLPLIMDIVFLVSGLG